jgi:hypothetical protein
VLSRLENFLSFMLKTDASVKSDKFSHFDQVSTVVTGSECEKSFVYICYLVYKKSATPPLGVCHTFSS